MDKKKGKLFDKFYSEKVVLWLDHLTFPRIFLLWATIILLFALGYSIFSSDTASLINSKTDLPVTDVSDCIYFSFITATTTGFGDITPIGAFKLFAIIEVISGLILLAFVTSRLVSIKQNVILDQIYDISLSDNVSRLRLSLSNFINNLNEFIIVVQNNSPNSKQIQEINFNFLQYEDIIKKIISVSLNNGRNYIKTVNTLDNELLIFNLLNSLEKITIFFEIAKKSKITSNKLTHSKKILQRNYQKIETFLNSFEDIDGEFDLENYVVRKDRALQGFNKVITLKSKDDVDKSK